MNPRAVRKGVRLSWPRQLPVRTHTEIAEEWRRRRIRTSRQFDRLLQETRVTPEEIVERIARMTDPSTSFGAKEASSKHGPRRLDFDKEWESETIEEVVLALSRRKFYPFLKD